MASGTQDMHALCHPCEACMLCSKVHREHQGAVCRPMASVVAVGPPQCLLKQEQNDAAPKTSPTGCIPEQIQWYSCCLLNSCSEPVGVTARLYGSVVSAAFLSVRHHAYICSKRAPDVRQYMCIVLWARPDNLLGTSHCIPCAVFSDDWYCVLT